MNKVYKLVIFDWEGTIVDSFTCHKSGFKLFPDVEIFINKLFLAKVNLAIASNKHYDALRKALEISNLKQFFPVIRCAEQTALKPCPQMLNEILAEYFLTSNDALMIGDSVQDVEMARYINMDVIGIDHYRQNTAELFAAQATQVFDNYNDIMKFLSL